MPTSEFFDGLTQGRRTANKLHSKRFIGKSQMPSAKKEWETHSKQSNNEILVLSQKMSPDTPE